MESIDPHTLNELRHGQGKALEKVYLFYNGRVYNFICSLVRDHTLSKDLTQDVFLQLWNKRESIDPSGHFNGYIFTIARNMVYQHIRRELLLQNYIQHQEEESIMHDSETERKLDDTFFRENILRLIEELPESRRKIFLLYWRSEMSYREIAEALSISEKIVATQVRRSLQFLYERLDKTLLLALLSTLTSEFLC